MKVSDVVRRRGKVRPRGRGGSHGWMEGGGSGGPDWAAWLVLPGQVFHWLVGCLFVLVELVGSLVRYTWTLHNNLPLLTLALTCVFVRLGIVNST